MVKASTPELALCTTIFDLLPNGRSLAVYPGATSTYALRLDRAAIDMLADTLACRAACAVPALHPVHGRRLLALRPFTMPHEPSWTDRPANAPPYLGPMELSLDLPGGNGTRVLFRREHLLALTDTLAEIQQSLTRNGLCADRVTGHPSR
ncbi:hypothetical protein [Actinokineospora sp.]|uniref:hypothetical protein n=1 Tax=Actinokineospora sp. TaxID=1872133 RepID=UPI003D6B53D7